MPKSSFQYQPVVKSTHVRAHTRAKFDFRGAIVLFYIHLEIVIFVGPPTIPLLVKSFYSFWDFGQAVVLLLYHLAALVL
jgi:hypothetical protein